MILSLAKSKFLSFILLNTLLLDPAKAEEKITEKTMAIIGVDYAGQTCNCDKLREISDKHGLRLVADGCHALGISQLQKLPGFLKRRRGIAARYDEAFAGLSVINPLALRPDALHAYHLYVIRIDPTVISIDRTTLFTNLCEKGIGVNVHYIPVHLQQFYRDKFNTRPGLCPNAEVAYE